MTRAAAVVLATIAAALIGTISLELFASSGEAKATITSTAKQHRPMLPQQAPDQQDRKQEWVATILARPLFSRDRRPLAAPGQSIAVAATGVPRLTGILISPLGKTAIFAAVDGGKPIVVSEGSHLGRFVVQSIDVGQVTIIGPEGQDMLRPSFDNATAPTPPAAPAPKNDSGQVSQGVAN